MNEEEVQTPHYDASIQGDPGSNSEVAARILLENSSPRLLYCERSEEAFEAVANGTVEKAVIAVENAIAGAVDISLDLLYDHKLYINAETRIKIVHALIGLPGVKLEEISHAHSHIKALAQCQHWLRQRGIRSVPENDTAGAVDKVIKEGKRGSAGIAGPWTAEMYGGVVLADNIADNRENYTRFFLVSREPHFPFSIDEYKVSVVFLLPDEPGTLWNALGPFAQRKINVSNPDKRPIPGDPFKYRFYLDLEGKAGQGLAMDEALSELERVSDSMRVLGKFPVFALAIDTGQADGNEKLGPDFAGQKE